VQGLTLKMSTALNKQSTVKPAGRAQGQGKGQENGVGREKRRHRRSTTETKLSFEFYMSEGNTYQNTGDFSRAITGYSKV
jgi:hypothetical protein